jgi:hypothetical protein
MQNPNQNKESIAVTYKSDSPAAEALFENLQIALGLA